MADPFVKDAADVLDYTINWASELATGETISTSSWTVTTGITKDSDTKTTTTTTIFVSGGTLAATYTLYNTVVTSGARTFKRYIQVKIAEIYA
jgi:hypothetical protein